MPFKFEVKYHDKKTNARVGVITTPHGTVVTPSFVPVGTQASIKGLTPKQIKNAGVQVFFVNTYHLYLRPGEGVVEKLGGVHRFMSWEGPIMSDSGGFQVFSLGSAIEHGVGKVDIRGIKRRSKGTQKLAEVDEDGVYFKSHLDGTSHRLDAEKSLKIQSKLGADFVLAFDDHSSPLDDYKTTKRSMERTHRWALRSYEAYERYCDPERQVFYGIVQGGLFTDLRKESAEFVSSLPVFGIAVGGPQVEDPKRKYEIWNAAVSNATESRPMHILGVGYVKDIFNIVEMGADSFDCVTPTRNGRNGSLYLKSAGAERNFLINIRNSKYIKDDDPVDSSCECYTCRDFSRSYLNHLFKSREMLGPILATIHNLYFFENMMREIRESIRSGSFRELKREWLA